MNLAKITIYSPNYSDMLFRCFLTKIWWIFCGLKNWGLHCTVVNHSGGRVKLITLYHMKAWTGFKPSLGWPEIFLGLGKSLGPPGGPQGTPKGPLEVQKGSLKNLMKYCMLGINFLYFQHWKWIQDQQTFKILNQTPMGWPMGVPGLRAPLGGLQRT